MSESPAGVAEWFAEANALSGEKRWADAVARYRRVLEASPRHEWALNNMGYCLSQAGDHEEAARGARAAAPAGQRPANWRARERHGIDPAAVDTASDALRDAPVVLVDGLGGYLARLLDEHEATHRTG